MMQLLCASHIVTLGASMAKAAVRANSDTELKNGRERYNGTRIRTFDPVKPTEQSKAFDDRYTVVDDETVQRSGLSIERDDAYDFEPIGTPVESPAPQVAERTRMEQIVRRDKREAIEVRQEIDTIDHQTDMPTILLVGVSQNETKTTTYEKPRLALVFSGSRTSVANDIARRVRSASRYSEKTTTIAEDGSLDEKSGASPAIQTYSQSPAGDARYYSGAAGFYSNEYRISAPTGDSGSKTIHVDHVTTGRAVGPNPEVRTSFDVPDWYPGGTPGAEKDVVRAAGIVALPQDCHRPVGLARGYETVETRSATRAVGDISNETITTYTAGETIVCSIDDLRIETHDPTTGLITATSSDRMMLHLERGSKTAVSIDLVAPHVMPIHQPADPHVTGAPALVLQTEYRGIVGIHISPATIDSTNASVTVASSLVDAAFGSDRYITVDAGAAPGRTKLTVRLRGQGGAEASLPIFIYKGLSIGCEGDQMQAAAFTQYGSVELVTDPAHADVYADCKDERSTQALHFPLGVTVLRFDDNSAVPFTTVRADRWQPQTDVLDSNSSFAGFIRTPGSAHDDSQNILLIKTHIGEIVKVECDGRAAYSLVGKFAISKNGVFAF